LYWFLATACSNLQAYSQSTPLRRNNASAALKWIRKVVEGSELANNSCHGRPALLLRTQRCTKQSLDSSWPTRRHGKTCTVSASNALEDIDGFQVGMRYVACSRFPHKDGKCEDVNTFCVASLFEQLGCHVRRSASPLHGARAQFRFHTGKAKVTKFRWWARATASQKKIVALHVTVNHICRMHECKS